MGTIREQTFSTRFTIKLSSQYIPQVYFIDENHILKTSAILGLLLAVQRMIYFLLFIGK